ncbi:hypothetical protein [Parasulfitobacter algicola]|uniref:Uncharacterized protein n=1 Tax=Parasulfitobacter algicola TaxID=2614809 RepID=A0ABX2IY88_9RHOB|nr:hypothetical protein [Sulfitobacter algicola]NSX56107.1 hypothetical protein [Sulfitobacter algicola]
MAKLAQLKDWISQAIDDAPRARSMMLVSRKSGIFTTGGRGGGAPEMTEKDAAYATLLALFDGSTVQSADALIELASLPLASVRICPNGPREPENIIMSSGFDNSDTPLPSHFKQLPKTALEALIRLFSHDDPPYHFCQVSIVKSVRTSVKISIMDPDVEIDTDLCSETDFFECTFEFSNAAISDKAGLQMVNSNRWITGYGLSDLYCLIHGITEADLDARDEHIMVEHQDDTGNMNA